MLYCFTFFMLYKLLPKYFWTFVYFFWSSDFKEMFLLLTFSCKIRSYLFQKHKSERYILMNNGTAPYFIQFSQNLTCDCLLISVFCPPNLPELNLKLFCSDVQNNFKFSSGKFGENRRNQHTITCQVLAELNEIWSCLIFL